MQQESILVKTQIQHENIPTELKELMCWTTWRYEQKAKGKKPSKVPYFGIGSNKASITDPSTWLTFSEAIDAMGNPINHGINFAFVASHGFVGIDLDRSIKEDGTLTELAQEIVDLCRSYTEISPSSRGLRIVAKVPESVKIEDRNDKISGIEVYKNGHFLSMTGNLLRPDLNEVRQLDHEVMRIITEKMHPSMKEKIEYIPREELQGYKTDAQVNDILHRMFSSRFGEEYRHLYEVGYLNSNGSTDDWKLASEVVYQCDGDVQKAKEIILQSALYNSRPERWEQRATRYGSYLDLTLYNALCFKKNAIDKRTKNTQGTPQVDNAYLNYLEQQIPPENNAQLDFVKAGPIDEISLMIQLNESLEKSEDTGKVYKNARNIERILNSRFFEDVLGYDVFRNREVIFKDLPWRKRNYPNKPYENWLPNDDNRLRNWLDKNFNLTGEGKIKDALIERMEANSFHPVKEFITSTQWDGLERIETFFIDWLGAEDNSYVRAVARKWFVAAVKRIYEPGCKFDYLPVLVGDQGAGKSSTIAKLAGDWFNDSLASFDAKEAGELLQSGWIFEIAELSAMKKSDEEEIKKFLSKQVDSFRPAYSRVVVDNPRHCVFIGTTNTTDFLRDSTGNRRFLPITVSTVRKCNPFTDLTNEIVNQLWAEAYIYYINGEEVDLENEVKLFAKQIQLEHTEMDPQAGRIEMFLEMKLPKHWDSLSVYERRNWFIDKNQGEIAREKVCAAEIWSECLGHETKDMTVHDARKINSIIRLLGWKERKPARTRFKHYGLQTTFINENNQGFKLV